MTVLMPLRRDGNHAKTPLRLRPRDGHPRCFLEQVAQHVAQNKLAWYVAFWVTLIGVIAVAQYAFDYNPFRH